MAMQCKQLCPCQVIMYTGGYYVLKEDGLNEFKLNRKLIRLKIKFFPLSKHFVSVLVAHVIVLIFNSYNGSILKESLRFNSSKNINDLTTMHYRTKAGAESPHKIEMS